VVWHWIPVLKEETAFDVHFYEILCCIKIRLFYVVKTVIVSVFIIKWPIHLSVRVRQQLQQQKLSELKLLSHEGKIEKK
jgi:hypothetical protein